MDWATFFAWILREYLATGREVKPQDSPYIKWVESDRSARPATPIDTIVRPEPPFKRDTRWGFEAYVGDAKVKVLGLGLADYFVRVLRDGKEFQVSPDQVRLPSGQTIEALLELGGMPETPAREVDPEMLWYHQRFGIVEELRRYDDWVVIRLLDGDVQDLEDWVGFELDDCDELEPLEVTPERTVHVSELIPFDALKALKPQDGLWIAYSLPVEDDTMFTEDGFLRVLVELTPVYRDELHDPYVYALCIDENHALRIVPTWMLMNVHTGERYEPMAVRAAKKARRGTVIKGRVVRPAKSEGYIKAKIASRIA